jgi:hypothetical protein
MLKSIELSFKACLAAEQVIFIRRNVTLDLV